MEGDGRDERESWRKERIWMEGVVGSGEKEG